MKTLKLISATLLAAAVASSAFAANLKITGSTAIRKALYAGIVRTLAAPAGSTVYTICCDPNFNNKTPDGAQQAVFVQVVGGVIGDTVQTCLSGSIGGLGYVITGGNVQTSITSVGNPATAWLHIPAVGTVTANWPSVTVTAGGAFTYSGGTITLNGAAGNLGQTSTVAAGNFDPAATASVTMADTYQDSSQYDSTDWGVSLADTQEGTVTFTFVKGQAQSTLPAGAYAALTNISAQNFQALTQKGFISLQQITGNAAYANVDVVLVGRNSDSGTRFGVFAETGVGPGSTGAKQYIPLDPNGVDASQSNSTLTIKSWQLLASDQDGYDSGAFVKQTCLDTIVAGAVGPGGAGHTFIEVAYVGMGDNPGASLQLAYNGVAENQANVINGTYTLWTTEHFLVDSANVGAGATLANSIKANVTATNSNGDYVNQGGLSCHRAGFEGSTILVP